MKILHLSRFPNPHTHLHQNYHKKEGLKEYNLKFSAGMYLRWLWKNLLTQLSNTLIVSAKEFLKSAIISSKQENTNKYYAYYY